MKKIFIAVILLCTLFSFAGSPKIFYLGMIDRNGNEYNNTTISGVLYEAWLEQGTGQAVTPFQIIRSTDGLPACFTGVFADPINRGYSKIDLQNFDAWGLGNILHIEMVDWNEGADGHCKADFVFTINNVSTSAVTLGFADLGITGLENSGLPWILSLVTGSEPEAVSVIGSSVESGIFTLSWNSVNGSTGYNIYSSADPYGTYNLVTTVSTTNWQVSAGDSKKFYYVTSMNDVKSKPEETITVKEKK
jgi:hypothetical protein